jgi:hypothetical protein
MVSLLSTHTPLSKSVPADFSPAGFVVPPSRAIFHPDCLLIHPPISAAESLVPKANTRLEHNGICGSDGIGALITTDAKSQNETKLPDIHRTASENGWETFSSCCHSFFAFCKVSR